MTDDLLIAPHGLGTVPDFDPEDGATDWTGPPPRTWKTEELPQRPRWIDGSSDSGAVQRLE